MCPQHGPINHSI
jgi:hypothetical protein